MFEFKKICESYEVLTPVERGLLLAEKSVTVLAGLDALALPGIDPIETLAGFLIGSVAADGRIDEREYLLIYPSLVRVFGENFDFSSVKRKFRTGSDCRDAVVDYTTRLMRVIDLLDSSLADDLVILCLCTVSIDGRISLREKNYIKRLCKA